MHWDNLRHLSPPQELTLPEWWMGLKFARRSISKPIALCDSGGQPFSFGLVDPVALFLHELDFQACGSIRMPKHVTTPGVGDQYLVRSLIEESITSSLVEGAATTRAEAKAMLKEGRRPRTHGERMVLNNYLTMQRIVELKNEALTEEMILDLHRRITEDTLEDPTAAGRFRKPGEWVRVMDYENQVLHEPPPAEQLGERMRLMCNFANQEIPDYFIHPAIRAMILHFWLAHDHPFKDGNGRAARALFYWSMLRSGYWLCEFISISRIILQGPAKYGRAFLYTETDENDLTYFVLYHVDIVRRAVAELHEYVERKSRDIEHVERLMRGKKLLNHRQESLVSDALHHPDRAYSIEVHQRQHRVAYQTARVDLLDLANRGLFVARKRHRRWYFRPVEKLDEALRDLGDDDR